MSHKVYIHIHIYTYIYMYIYKGCLALYRGNLLCKFTWTTTHECMLSCYSHVQLCVTSSVPGSSVMGLSRQEHWSGLPCQPLGDLSSPETELASLSLLYRQMSSLPLAPPGKPERGRYGCMDWKSNPGLLSLLAGMNSTTEPPTHRNY